MISSAMYVAANDRMSFFLWLNSISVCTSITFSSAVCASMDISIVCISWILWSAARNRRVHMSLQHTDFISSGLYPVAGLLSHLVVLFLTSGGASVLYTFYIYYLLHHCLRAGEKMPKLGSDIRKTRDTLASYAGRGKGRCWRLLGRRCCDRRW